MAADESLPEWGRPVIFVAELIHHVQKILRVTKAATNGGVNVGAANAVTVAHGCNRWHGPNNAVDLFVSEGFVLVHL